MLGVVRGGRPQGGGGAGSRGEEGRAEGLRGGAALDYAGLRHVGSGTLFIEGAGGGRAREGVGGSHEWRLGLSEIYQGAGVAERTVDAVGRLHCRVVRRT